jgi:methionine-rich copper-binding protein CopC
MSTLLTERRRARGARAPRVLLALLAAALLVLNPLPASAHDHLTDSSPRDGQVVPAPTELVLTFSANISAVGTQVELTGPDGVAPTGDPQVDGPVVTVPVTGQLAAGAYTVAWRVTSSDGHPISGEFGFEVETATEEPTTTPPPTGTTAPEEETTAPTGTTTEAVTTTAEETTPPASTPSASTAPETTPPAEQEETADEGVSPWVWVVAGVVVIGLVGLVVALGRRES